MQNVPFLGRLTLGDYYRLFITAFIIVFELFVRIFVGICALFRIPLYLTLFQSYDNGLAGFYSKDDGIKKIEEDSGLSSASSTMDMAGYWYQMFTCGFDH